MGFFREQLQRLARFVEALDRRHDGEKAFFVCALATAVHVFLTSSFLLLYGLAPPGVEKTRDIPYGWFVAKGMCVGMIFYLLFLFLTRWTYKHSRFRSIVTYLLFQTVGTIQFFVVQSLGTFSTAMMIVYPADVAFVFLLFDERKALFVLLYGGFLFTCIGILEHLRILPYAPLLAEAIRPVPPPLPALLQEIFFIWTFSGLLYLILFYVHYSLRKAHRELSDAKDQLVRAESLAAVGTLVTGAAHELRNPLSSSGAILQSLMEDFECEEAPSEQALSEMRDSLRQALVAQARAAAIVDRLYRLTEDFVQVSSRCRLSTLLDSIARRYKGVVITCAGIDFSTLVRERALDTILSNLLDNAIAAGGTTPPSLTVGLKDGHLEFTVSDSGRGIPRKILPDVFKPFVTGQKAGEGHGVGLGLYIVHELIARLSGSVDLQSEEGRGTRVAVRLPPLGFQEGAVS
ncbi:MAG: HAMP domain-containing sensor histidine kinase [Bdellovibrionota bacterium]